MTNEELRKLLSDKSEDWRAGFFVAVNLTSDTKAAFLKNMIGQSVVMMEEKESVLVIEPKEECTCGQKEDMTLPYGGHTPRCPAAIPF